MKRLSSTVILAILILASPYYCHSQNNNVRAGEPLVKCKDVGKLVNVADENILKSSLIILIASDEFEQPYFTNEDCNVLAEVFKINDHIRPTLRSLLENAELFPQAARLLSYFADEGDRRLLIKNLDSRNDLSRAKVNEVRQALAGELIAPKSEREWGLLKGIVACEGEDDTDWFMVEQAALTLAADGSDRALSVLRSHSKCERPPAAESAVRLAIRWINKHPGPVEPNADLKKGIAAASQIFNYSGKPDRLRINKVVVDRAGVKALVFCTVDAGGEYYYYRLVFQKGDNAWLLKGVWSAGFAF
jgi:hypothetical protein